MRREFWLLSASACWVICMAPAQAALVTIVGSEFDVVYDTTQLGLFATPSLVGNNLFFTPSAFSAESLNGAGTVATPSLASGIELIAHPGYQFGTLALATLGDYVMLGAGSSVGVTGSLTASDAANPLTQTVAALTISPTTPLNIIDGQNHNWLGTASINNATPTVAAGHNPWLGSAAVIDLQLQNTLTATSVMGPGQQQAFIQEKFSGVEVMIDPLAVPLPAAVWLLGSGLAGMACWGRRKVQPRKAARLEYLRRRAPNSTPPRAKNPRPDEPPPPCELAAAAVAATVTD